MLVSLQIKDREEAVAADRNHLILEDLDVIHAVLVDFGGEVGQERAAIEEEELSLSGAHDDAVRGRAD